MTAPIRPDAPLLRPKDKVNGRHTIVNGLAALLCPSVSGRTAPLLRLFLELYDGPKGEAVTVEIYEMDGWFELGPNGSAAKKDEGSQDDLLAAFTVIPVQAPSGGRPWWENPVVQKGPDNSGSADSLFDKPPEKHVPYVRLTFAGKDYPKQEGEQQPDAKCPVFYIPILSEKGENEGDRFELGYVIKDSGGQVLSRSDSNIVQLWMHRLFTPWAHEGALLALDNSLGSEVEKWFTHAHLKQDRLDGSRIRAEEAEKKKAAYQKALADALKELEAHLKDSTNTYDIYVQKYRQYMTLLVSFAEEVKKLDMLSDRDRQTYETVLALRREELEKQKKDLDAYLTTTGSMPKSFEYHAAKVREVRERNKCLDEFLDHPLVKVLCILPGSGILSGGIKILQGKYVEGFASMGLDLLTYGSWKKLETMADVFLAFDQYGKNGNNALKALVEYHYSTLALARLRKEAGKLRSGEALADLVAKADPGFHALYSTIKGFKNLKDSGDSIAKLMRCRTTIREIATEASQFKEINSPASFVQFVKDVGFYNDFLLFVDSVKSIKSLNDQLERIKKLSMDLQIKENADFEKSLSETFAELQPLSKHKDVLPSSEFISSATEAAFRLLDYLNDANIMLSAIIHEIPQEDLNSISADNGIPHYNRLEDLESLSGVKLNHTKAELQAMLEQIKAAYKNIVPIRYQEYKRWHLDRIHYWKNCQWDCGLEEIIDKLSDELEARQSLLGAEVVIRPWLYGWSVPLHGRSRIYNEGFAFIGINLCEMSIEAVS